MQLVLFKLSAYYIDRKDNFGFSLFKTYSRYYLAPLVSEIFLQYAYDNDYFCSLKTKVRKKKIFKTYCMADSFRKTANAYTFSKPELNSFYHISHVRYKVHI